MSPTVPPTTTAPPPTKAAPPARPLPPTVFVLSACARNARSVRRSLSSPCHLRREGRTVGARQVVRTRGYVPWSGVGRSLERGVIGSLDRSEAGVVRGGGQHPDGYCRQRDETRDGETDGLPAARTSAAGNGPEMNVERACVGDPIAKGGQKDSRPLLSSGRRISLFARRLRVLLMRTPPARCSRPDRPLDYRNRRGQIGRRSWNLPWLCWFVWWGAVGSITRLISQLDAREQSPSARWPRTTPDPSSDGVVIVSATSVKRPLLLGALLIALASCPLVEQQAGALHTASVAAVSTPIAPPPQLQPVSGGGLTGKTPTGVVAAAAKPGVKRPARKTARAEVKTGDAVTARLTRASAADVQAGTAAEVALSFALDQLGKPYVWGAEGPGCLRLFRADHAGVRGGRLSASAHCRRAGDGGNPGERRGPPTG